MKAFSASVALAQPTAWLAQRSLRGRRYVVAQRRMDVAVMF